METINGIDLVFGIIGFLMAKWVYSNKTKSSKQPLKQGEQYFNDQLANHLNCQLDITEYLCETCGEISYRLLRCNEASDCVDEAVGIAVQFEHDCHQ